MTTTRPSSFWFHDEEFTVLQGRLVTRSLSIGATLGWDGTVDSHYRCAADKSATLHDALITGTKISEEGFLVDFHRELWQL